MQQHELRVQSATGVELVFPIAGTGTRSFAFLIDWHIRLVVALAWFFVAAFALLGSLRFDPGTSNLGVLAAVLPALAIYFLYHPVLEIAMGGRTPGKRMAGVRLVTHTGAPPSAGALLLRNAFRLIDALPAMYLVGLVTTLVTAQQVRIGDLAAGTVLVHDRGDARDALARLTVVAGPDGLDPALLGLVDELLRRWSELAPERREALARLLVTRADPALDAAALAVEDSAALRERLQTLAAGRRTP